MLAVARLCPTGKSLPIYGNRIKPQNKKHFALSEGQIKGTSSSPSRPTQRGVGHRHNEGRVAVDADVATDERD